MRGPRGTSCWIGSWSKIGLRANSDAGVAIGSAGMLDRVLVKDRLESKLRLADASILDESGWIGSWSKIGLRANSDRMGCFLAAHLLDRVLVKDRLESKLRPRVALGVGR